MSNCISKTMPPGGWAAEQLKTAAALEAYLCELAVVTNSKGRAIEVYRHVCAACDSPCAYGRKYLAITTRVSEANRAPEIAGGDEARSLRRAAGQAARRVSEANRAPEIAGGDEARSLRRAAGQAATVVEAERLKAREARQRMRDEGWLYTALHPAQSVRNPTINKSLCH